MLKWESGEYGSSWSVRIGPGLWLNVSWDSTRPKESDAPPYVVNVFGMCLKNRFDDQKEAKAYAESCAKQWLSEALSKFSTS